MKDPERLERDPVATELQRKLISAWNGERPPPGARARTLRALGVGALVGSAAALAPKTASAAAGSVAPKAVLGSVAWAKWLGVGLLAAAVALTTAVVVNRAAPRTTARSMKSAVPQPSATATVPWSEIPSAVLASLPPPPVETVAVPTSGVPRQEVSRPSTPAPASLGEQLASLDRGRAALDEGDAVRAQKLVDDHDAHYRDGAFAQEAIVLRIRILLQRGERVQAERLGAQFLATHPKSPHAGRVRALLNLGP